jgi:hypothetical protein
MKTQLKALKLFLHPVLYLLSSIASYFKFILLFFCTLRNKKASDLIKQIVFSSNKKKTTTTTTTKITITRILTTKTGNFHFCVC